jgi:alpha-L-rhamnosidase
MRRTILVLPLLLLLISFTPKGDDPGLTPNILRCEYRVDPLGIDELHPLFSWTFRADRRNQYQTTYRILVSTDPADLKVASSKPRGIIWDSGKVPSTDNIAVAYAGPRLRPFTRYYWKVRTWNRQDIASAWSSTAWFETAFLRDQGPGEGWKGEWIGDGQPTPTDDADFYRNHPAPLFRKDFASNKPIRTARLYIAGLGYNEAYLNGTKIGDHVLDPGWTDYSRTVLYNVYDVTTMVHPGLNRLGVILGNGWYNPLPLRLFGAFNFRDILSIGHPAFIARLRLVYTDGTTFSVDTDPSWTTHPSDILTNNIYLGETQDGRLEEKHWADPPPANDSPADSAWHPVAIALAPAGVLRAQSAPPIRITRLIDPVSIAEVGKDTFVVDFGQNFAGWMQMSLHGQPGQAVSFRYGEILFPDGHVNGLTTVAGHVKKMWNVNGGPGAPATAWQQDGYTCRGDTIEFFRPHFTFHAFRYVEITGLTKAPDLSVLQGERLNSDVQPAGHFTCSNPLYNHIQQNTLFTFLSNQFSVQSDCPGRERQGYGADMVTSCEAYIYNFDMSCQYAKAVSDFADDARPNGGMPECAPYNGISTEGFADGAGPIGWELAFPYLQEQLFRFYGNRRIIENNYAATKKLVAFLQSQAVNDSIGRGIGDHVAIDAKHVPLTSTAFYYHHVRLLTEFATLLGRRADAQHYQKLSARIARSFNQRYLHADAGVYDTAYNAITQVFPLWYDLVPTADRGKALTALLDYIRLKRQNHFSTGIFGTKMLYDVLRRFGRDSITCILTGREDYPGYGYMIRQGASTLWETWEKPDQASWNHPMFGSISEWFFRSLLGINPAADAEGMDRIVLRPYTGSGLTFANGEYASVRGTIVSDWIRENGQWNWTVALPGNITARLYIPAGSVRQITESGRPVERAGLRYVGRDGGSEVFIAGSGTYHFTVKQ